MFYTKLTRNDKMMASGVSPWISRYGVTELLELLHEECRRIPHAYAKDGMRADLKILIAQSKKAVIHQDRKKIIEAWRRLHPDLTHYGILNVVNGEPMKTKILCFLRGNPITPKEASPT